MLSPSKPKCTKASSVSVINGLSKTIFPLKLYQLEAVSQVTLTINVQNQDFPSVIEEQPFQDHPPIKIILSTQLSPRRPKQLIWYRVQAFQVSTMHSLFKTIFLIKLSYQVKALSPRRKAQSFASQETYTMNVQSLCFHIIPDEQPFQEHLTTKTIIMTQSCLLGHLNCGCGEPGLP